MSGDERTDYQVSDRGFKNMAPIPCRRPGTDLRIYESSAAEEPCIWVLITVGDSDLAAHITLDAAEVLRDQLGWLIDHHYQVDEA